MKEPSSGDWMYWHSCIKTLCHLVTWKHSLLIQCIGLLPLWYHYFYKLDISISKCLFCVMGVSWGNEFPFLIEQWISCHIFRDCVISAPESAPDSVSQNLPQWADPAKITQLISLLISKALSWAMVVWEKGSDPVSSYDCHTYQPGVPPWLPALELQQVPPTLMSSLLTRFSRAHANWLYLSDTHWAEVSRLLLWGAQSCHRQLPWVGEARPCCHPGWEDICTSTHLHGQNLFLSLQSFTLPEQILHSGNSFSFQHKSTLELRQI